jgi:hypothetical protein
MRLSTHLSPHGSAEQPTHLLHHVDGLLTLFEISPD